ncbi:hypothetical protein [uncultured Gimesia sp.]|uniref:amino acid kinase family protein n=1 Tax=uncultured Gimesia sp. TaxID=1678688 RepID=UPI0026374A4C|nr:hypothetical protein [uncultured Gimesia sp.]
MKTVVIKVGGSLFDLPDLSARLSRLLIEFEYARPLLICGGGDAANLVRSWDQSYDLGKEATHWLAIQSLMLNDRLLCELLPNARVVSSRAEAAEVWKDRKIPVLCSDAYLKQMTETDIAPLPPSWDVTSDSIAAWVTLTWPAEELVLLKSVDLPRENSLTKLSQAGLVDRYFPNFSESLPSVHWCNLRCKDERAQLTTVINGKSFHIRNATGPA